MDLEKVREITDWSSPRSMFEVRSFHGLVSFYRKFIRHFSGICAPILDTIKKWHKYFNWTEEGKKGFRELNSKITEQPILVLPDFKKTFHVKCDASGEAIGAILSQDNKPVSYFSDKLNDVKRKYSTYEKYFYDVIQALKKWRHYLISKEIVLYTDDQAFKFITRQEKLNQRHEKWVEFMQNFTFVINHISGRTNKVVDDLSRRCLILQEFQVETLGFQHLKEMYKEDPNFKEAYEACENPLLREKNQWMEYLIQDGLFFKGSRLCILKCSMRDNLLKENHSGGLGGHFVHDKTYAQLSSSYYWPRMRSDMKKFLDRCKIFQYAKGKQQSTRLYQSLPLPEPIGEMIQSSWWFKDFQR
jgi:hypothetical protein